MYKTTEGVIYPSVSSILSKTEDTSYIQEWVNSVGEEKAAIISKLATSRGTRIHELCEIHLNNIIVKPSIFDVDIFNSLKPILARIDNIRGVECQVYSEILQIAGTIDLVAEFDGVLSIIDWKTSNKMKRRGEIYSYFKQTAAYALAWRELTGEIAQNLVVIIASDDQNEASVFKEVPFTWIPEFIKNRKQFKLKYQI